MLLLRLPSPVSGSRLKRDSIRGWRIACCACPLTGVYHEGDARAAGEEDTHHIRGRIAQLEGVKGLLSAALVAELMYKRTTTPHSKEGAKLVRK